MSKTIQRRVIDLCLISIGIMLGVAFEVSGAGFVLLGLILGMVSHPVYALAGVA